MNKLLLILTVFCCPALYGQDSAAAAARLHAPADTALYSSLPNKKRVRAAAATSMALYTGAIVALSDAWYKNYAQTAFHFFNDNSGWLQVDKAGHVYSAYNLTRLNNGLWQWAGVPHRKRVWISGLSSTAFLTAIEVLDGLSEGWGFSLGDLGADIAGSGLYMAQELVWNEQRVQLKFSFHRNNYTDPSLHTRANEMFGNAALERILKDYNGQTYWASINLKSFYKRSNLPEWLNIAIGYGAEGMFGGTDNIAEDKNGNIIFNRSDVPRYRQWYIAPDIDLTKIRTKSKFLKTAFSVINSLKFPSPSIGFSKRGIEWNWLHF